MKIQILGPGCTKCRTLVANAQAAVALAGIDAQIEKIDRIEDIVRFGVMTTPALAVDGKVRSAGRVLAVDEIRKLLT